MVYIVSILHLGPGMDKFLSVAITSARKAGKIIKKGFYLKKAVEKKGKVNLLTKYDTQCEKLIVQTIKKHFPSHSILAEEGTSSDKTGEYRWIIDPLDGTTNFVHSIPFVAVSIALEKNGELILGVVYNPILNELFTAVKGRGAYLNLKQRLYVSNVDKIINCLVATGFPYDRFHIAKELGRTVEKMCANAKGLRRTGSASMDLCYVANARFDAYFEKDLKPWDIAAGMIIVMEAGGVICDYFGNNVDFNVCDIVACGHEIKNELLELLRK